MAKKYQYLLFDWDGCLAQTLQIHLNAYKETFSDYHIFPTDLDVTQQVFGDWNGPLKLGVTDNDLSAFTQKYLDRVDQNYASAPLYPYAFSTIKSLSEAGKDLALITATTIRLVQPALEKTGVTDFFRIILTSEDVEKHKPDPEIVEKAIQKLDGNKDQAIIIGDSKSDLGGESINEKPSLPTVFC